MSRYDNEGLTTRERDIYNFIVQFKTINGFSPTISEIADGIITSRTFVRQALYKLEDKGIIRYNEHKVRSIVVTKMLHDKIIS